MSATELTEICQGLSAIGIDQYIFNLPNVHDIDPLEIFGKDIIPTVSEIV